MKKYTYQVDTEAQTAPAKILRAAGSGKRVLEVGCASGVQSRILKERQGCTITGIEIDAVAAEEARKYCESVVVGDLESMDLSTALGGRRYDVIIIADVLEHLRNPAKALTRLKPFLDEGAFILASIPNVVHAGLILEMAKGRFDYRPYGLLDDTHLRFFTLKSVYQLFEDCGLAVKHMDRVICPIEASEFYGHPLTPDEIDVLDFIRSNNPEWQTYQFIVTATPISTIAASHGYAELALRDRLRDKELANDTLTKRVKMLEGQIKWLESHPAYKLYSGLKKLFSK